MGPNNMTLVQQLLPKELLIDTYLLEKLESRLQLPVSGIQLLIESLQKIKCLNQIRVLNFIQPFLVTNKEYDQFATKFVELDLASDYTMLAIEIINNRTFHTHPVTRRQQAQVTLVANNIITFALAIPENTIVGLKPYHIRARPLQPHSLALRNKRFPSSPGPGLLHINRL